MVTKKKIYPMSRKEIIHSYDPLAEIEKEEGIELSERNHERAEKPIKRLKKSHSRPEKGYFPLHRR